MEHPTARFQKHGANGHHEEQWGSDGTDAQSWAFDRLDTYWAMAPLPPTDVATYLWGRERRDASHLPTTAPHGFVCLLPGAAPVATDRWPTRWSTDGDTLQQAGKAYSLTAARTAITAELAAGAKRFPFRIEGTIFHQIIEQEPGRYVVALIDPGWLNPADREVRLTAQTPGDWQVRDRLTGSKLGDLRHPLPLRVPAGTLRLVELSSKRVD
jgi:hypothetical protein